jgi:hypothetical protein
MQLTRTSRKSKIQVPSITEIPSSKFQAPEKLQGPNLQIEHALIGARDSLREAEKFWSLGFGNCLGFGFWGLGFLWRLMLGSRSLK